MIPKLHYISQGQSVQEHIDNIQNACASGAELVQLRLKDIDEAALLEAAEKARAITSHFQTRLIINDYYKIAKAVKADGVHLGKNDSCPTVARAYMEPWQIIGGTANTVADCKSLIDKKVDYIGLGPFRFTTTKENLAPVLGQQGYSEILEDLKTTTPIIAVGGISLAAVPELLKTGIHGVAVSEEITKNFNIISEFNTLLRGSSLYEQLWKPDQPDQPDKKD
jgi:thiamine-phosphate pyrophosphorylase